MYYAMDNVAQGMPLLSVRHEHDPFTSAASFKQQRQVGSTRINCRFTIEKFLIRFSRIEPNKRRGRRCSKGFAICFSLSLNSLGRVIFGLDQWLIDNWPSANVWRQMRAPRITSPISIKKVRYSCEYEQIE